MSFRLVPKSVTLNDLERRNGVILRYFSEIGQLPSALRKSSRSLSHLLMSSCCITEYHEFASIVYHKNRYTRILYGYCTPNDYYYRATQLCQRSIGSRNSVRLSARLSHACFVTNPKKLPAIFLCHILQRAAKLALHALYQLRQFRPSVRLSVTSRYCVKTTAHSTVRFALSDSKMCLVLQKPKNI